jgi:hypothetical protein
MPRPPIGEKAMTPAERQRRHRDIVTAPTMTKSEREDFRRLINNREKVLKTAAKQRSAELLAEFEQQVASEYSYNQDHIWEKAVAAAGAAVAEAQAIVEKRCEELGIPARFAPSIRLNWRERGEHAIKDRVVELRKVAATRIAAIEKAACSQIELQCLNAQTEVLGHGLSSPAAREFLQQLPPINTMMPALDFSQIEGMLDARMGERNRYLSADYL